MKLSKFMLAMLATIAVFNLACIIFQFGGAGAQLWVSDTLPVISALLAIIGVGSAFASLKSFDAAKVSWLLILLGVACFFAAETIYGIEELILGMDMDSSYPSLADLFWMIGYLPLLAGLALFIVAYVRGGLSFGRWAPALVPAGLAYLACAAAVVAFVFAPIQADAETGGLSKFAYCFYPAGDLCLLAPSIILVYLTGQFGRGKFSLPWKLIALGLACFSISDIAYTVLDWQGLYSGGGVTDLGWNLAYLFIALGGASQRSLIQSMGKGGGA
jgi:hypothetical protein